MLTKRSFATLPALFLVLLMLGFTASPAEARCAKHERKALPACIHGPRNLYKSGWIYGHTYKAINNCGRDMKLHEELIRGRDRSYVIKANETKFRTLSKHLGFWGVKYKRFQCCDTGEYTCEERGE